MSRRTAFQPAPPQHSRSAPFRLLETAIQLFARNGYEGTSLRDVAKGADISFQLIAYHFGSKEELWMAAVHHCFDQRKAAIEAAARDFAGQRRKAPRQWMANWVRTAILFTVEDPHLRQLITQEAVANSRRYEGILRPKLEELNALMESSFRHMIKVGLITRFAPWESVLLFRCLGTANVVMPYEVELAFGIPVSSPEYVEALVDLSMAMLTQGRGADVPRPRGSRAARRRTAVDVPESRKSLPTAKRTGASTIAPEDGRLARGRNAKERLIAASIKIFGASGFEGASLRTVAREAGLAFQLTRYHFGSKEELWAAALTHLFDTRLDRIRTRGFDPAGNLDNQFRQWIRVTLSDAVTEPYLRRIFTQEYFANSARYQKFLRPRIEEFMAAVAESYEQLIRLGVVTRFSAREVKLIFRSVVAANSLMPYDIQLSTGKPPGHEKSLELQVDLLFNLFKEGRGTRSARAVRAREPKRRTAG